MAPKPAKPGKEKEKGDGKERTKEGVPHAPQMTEAEGRQRKLARAARPHHPDTTRLWFATATGTLVGGNARCDALLTLLITLAKSFTMQPSRSKWSAEFRLEVLNPLVDHLKTARSDLCPAQASVIKRTKLVLDRAEAANLSPSHAAAALTAELREMLEREFPARRARLVGYVAGLIDVADVVLTFGRSSAVEAALLLLARDRPGMRCVVVDGAPLFEGRQMLPALTAAGISVTYCYLSGLSDVLPMATKIVIGAAGVLSGGHVVARAGAAVVSVAARRLRRPVVFVCEAYKYCERVWLSALSNPDPVPAALLPQTTPPMSALYYDLTPFADIDLIVTELCPIPPSAVNALLRDESAAASRVLGGGGKAAPAGSSSSP